MKRLDNHVELKPYGRYRVYVSRATGYFVAYNNTTEQTVTAETLEELKKDLDKLSTEAAAEDRINVPIISIDPVTGTEIANGILQAIHFPSGRPMVNGVLVSLRNFPAHVIHAGHPEVENVRDKAIEVSKARAKLENLQEELQKCIEGIGVPVHQFKLRAKYWSSHRLQEGELQTSLRNSLRARIVDS